LNLFNLGVVLCFLYMGFGVDNLLYFK